MSILKKCRTCGADMELVDEDPDLGKMWECPYCSNVYIKVGPGNAFDSTGWKF